MKRFSALASVAVLFFALTGATALAQGAAPEPSATAAPSAPSAQDGAASADETTAIALLLKPYASASDACLAALERAALLSAQGQWKSAFQVLEDFDKDNADPYALAMKTSLVLRGAVRTEMDRSFGLVDLQQGQDLDTVRNSEGDFPPIALDPPALAEAQAVKGVAAPGILSKVLGDYYFDVIGRFPGKWTISDDDVLAKVIEEYGNALAAGVYDSVSLVNQGETLVRLNRGDESDAIFRKAIGLDSRDPNVRYNYALSLTYRGKRAEALVEIDKAIEFYSDDTSRIDAIVLGVRTSAELGDTAKTQYYYVIADKYYPNTPTAGILRHMVALQMGDKPGAAEAADSLIPTFGSNPNVVRTLISTWMTAGDPEAARAFLDRNIAKSTDDLTLGTLNFYLTVLLSQDTAAGPDKPGALKALDAAEAHLKTALDADNQVFGIIADMRKNLEAPAAPEGAAAGGPAEGSGDGSDATAK